MGSLSFEVLPERTGMLDFFSGLRAGKLRDTDHECPAAFVGSRASSRKLDGGRAVNPWGNQKAER
jgi:hypothetical protein